MAWNRQAAGDERRWERRSVDLPIGVFADDLTGTGVILGRGTKISEGGICLFALANLAIGAQIDLELIASDCGTPVRVGGIVRNRLVYLYGVEFMIDQPEDRQQIARLSHIIGTTTDFRSSWSLAERNEIPLGHVLKSSRMSHSSPATLTVPAPPPSSLGLLG